jgi:hypothetical protein
MLCVVQSPIHTLVNLEEGVGYAHALYFISCFAWLIHAIHAIPFLFRKASLSVKLQVLLSSVHLPDQVGFVVITCGLYRMLPARNE